MDGDLEALRADVFADTGLRERLRGLDRKTFIRRTVELGRSRGYDVTKASVEEALRRARREWVERWI